MKAHVILSVCIAVFCSSVQAQEKFRNAVFLHHSTGSVVFDGNVPGLVNQYNSDHGYAGNDAVSMADQYYPEYDTPFQWNNDWWVWDSLFVRSNAVLNRWPSYSVIIFKSCFPSTYILSEGSDEDTAHYSTYPYNHSLYNYKYYWRRMVRTFAQHPDKFFCIWTNTPVKDGAYVNEQFQYLTAEQALRSDRFCRWAKDTLAAGLDPVIGDFPANVYVFDFFHYLTNNQGYLRPEFEREGTEAHINTVAGDTAAPHLVQEVFDAAIEYELTSGAAERLRETADLCLNVCPNPFNPAITITITDEQLPASLAKRVERTANTTLIIYNACGELVKDLTPEIRHCITWDASNQPSGVYVCRLNMGGRVTSKRLFLMK